MPSMANLTVKKNDGSTDITYTAVSASGGDKSPAVWRSNSVGEANGHRPEYRLQSRQKGDNSGRVMDGSYTYPSIVEGTDGKFSIVSRFNLKITADVPNGMPDDDLNEAVVQALNIMATTLNKDSFKVGYAPA